MSSNTTYSTDKEKVDDAMMRIQRIMRLRGVSGHVIITSGDECQEHFRLANDSFLTHEKNESSRLFAVEMNPKKVTRDVAIKTMKEIDNIGRESFKLGESIKAFMAAFSDKLKNNFS